MATQLMVAGPVTMTYGGTTLGNSDGQALITIQDVRPFTPITEDAAGGEPTDFIQLRGHAIVSVDLIRWDPDVLDDIHAAIASSSTTASPAFDSPGTAGTVGMLRIADGGYRQLVVTGTKVTASNGFEAYTFPRAFLDPNQPFEFRDVGARRPTRAVLNMRCELDGSGNVYTVAAVSS
jgi:hypothetical protein